MSSDFIAADLQDFELENVDLENVELEDFEMENVEKPPSKPLRPRGISLSRRNAMKTSHRVPRIKKTNSDDEDVSGTIAMCLFCMCFIFGYPYLISHFRNYPTVTRWPDFNGVWKNVQDPTETLRITSHQNTVEITNDYDLQFYQYGEENRDGLVWSHADEKRMIMKSSKKTLTWFGIKETFRREIFISEDGETLTFLETEEGYTMRLHYRKVDPMREMNRKIDEAMREMDFKNYKYLEIRGLNGRVKYLWVPEQLVWLVNLFF